MDKRRKRGKDKRKMIDEGKFGFQEAIWLTTITISTKAFYTSPGRLAGVIGNTGWYMTLIAMATAILGFSFIYILLKRFPGKDIVAIFSDTLGGFFGFIFSAILGFYLLLLAINTINEFTEVVKDYVYPLTPSPLIILIFVVGISAICLLGLETLARLAKLFIFIMLFGFIAILALGSHDYNINRLFPIFGYGADKVIKNGIIRSSAYGEIIIIAVFARSLQGTKFIKKIGYSSLVFSGILISSAFFAFALTFPYYITQEITSPMYELAMLIDYGRFVQRVEPIFLFVWFLSSFINIAALFYCFCSIYCKMFKIQYIEPIIFGSAAVFFTGTTIQSSMGVVASNVVQSIREYGWAPTFLLPIIALIVGIMRKRGVKTNG